MRTRPAITILALASVALSPVLVPASTGATDVAGVPASQIGRHGPVNDYHSGWIEPVGHTHLETVPEGETNPIPLGNNGAPAFIGDCAYVGRWHDYTGLNGVQIVDVSDPTSPQWVGRVTESAVRRAVSREIRAVDLPGFQMLTVMTFARYIDDTTPAANSFLFFVPQPDPETGEPDCRNLRLVGRYDMRSFRGHEFYLWLDPNRDHDVDGHPRVLIYATAPIGPPNVLVLDASRPNEPRLIGVYDAGLPVTSPRERQPITGDTASPAGLGTYAHSISLSPDGREAYMSYWDGGFFTVDTSDFAMGLPSGTIRPMGAMSVPFVYGPTDFGNTHSAVKIPGKNVAVVGDEIYTTTDGCPFGWMRLVDVGSASAPPGQVAEYRLPENQIANCDTSTRLVKMRNADGLPIDGTFSMHNQTVTNRFALASWYGGGLRVIDVADPAHPAEVGYFVPAPVETTSTVPTTSAPTAGRTVATQDDDWLVSTWSYPVIRDGLIYVTDVRNGLYVVRPVPGTPLADEIAEISFLEGNSNFGDFAG